MSSKASQVDNKARLRAMYSKESSVYMAYIISFLIGALIVASLVIVRLYQTRPAPKYFAVNDNLQMYTLPSLKQPSLSLSTLSNWVSNAALQTHTFDFNSISDAISESKQYFTQAGYVSYLDAIANFRDDIVENQLIVSCVIKEAPVIQRNFISQDKYYWLVEVPIILTFSSAAVSAKREDRKLTLILNRVDSTENPYGVSISGFRSEKI